VVCGVGDVCVCGIGKLWYVVWVMCVCVCVCGIGKLWCVVWVMCVFVT